MYCIFRCRAIIITPEDYWNLCVDFRHTRRIVFSLINWYLNWINWYLDWINWYLDCYAYNTHKSLAASLAQCLIMSFIPTRKLPCSRRAGMTNWRRTSSSCTSLMGLMELGGKKGVNEKANNKQIKTAMTQR